MTATDHGTNEMQRLSIDSRQAKYLNGLSDGIDLQNNLPTVAKAPEQAKGFKPDHHISANITDQDIAGNVQQRTLNHKGEPISLSESSNGNHWMIADESHHRFLELVEMVQGVDPFRNTISKSTIEKHLFAWLIERQQGVPEVDMCSYLLRACEAEIAQHEVWIPVARLSIETDLSVGKITFRQITRERFDAWKESLQSDTPKIKAMMSEHFEKSRKKLQGISAGYIELCADKERAKEIALEETDRAVAMLRLFHPASISPDFQCYCQPLTQQGMGNKTCLMFQDGVPSHWIEEAFDVQAFTWPVSNADVLEYNRSGLQAASRLLIGENTPFQDHILETLLLYSKVSVASDLSERLVFMLTALEYLLLKNKSERIKDNLSRRFAALLADNDDARKKLAEMVKGIYKSRSNFIHHAEKVHDLELLAAFMRDAWCLLIRVLYELGDKYTSKNEFISAIDQACPRKPAKESN